MYFAPNSCLLGLLWKQAGWYETFHKGIYYQGLFLLKFPATFELLKDCLQMCVLMRDYICPMGLLLE